MVLGFQFELVLANSAYGESGSSFVRTLHRLDLPYVLAIRSNYAMLVPKEHRARVNRGYGNDPILLANRW